jgi:hypothetical protein
VDHPLIRRYTASDSYLRPREVSVQDVEIESLLQEAGYQFVPASGRYEVADGDDEGVDYPTEDIADQLDIPIDDLIRWEEEQVASSETGEG